MNSPGRAPHRDKNKINDNKQKSEILSPKKHNTSELSPSPPQKKHLPSRVNANEILANTVQFSKSSLLNQLESNMVTLDNNFSKLDPDKLNNRIKEMQRYHPSKKPLKATEFKQKPIKRAEMDFNFYKEIFVQPKEKVLNELKEKEKTFEELFYKGASKQYDKILNPSKEENRPRVFTEIHSPNSSPRDFPSGMQKSLILNEATTSKLTNFGDGKEIKQLSSPISLDNLHSDLNPVLNKIIELDAIPMANSKSNIQNERTFFDQQIQVVNFLNIIFKFIIGATS